MRILLLASDSPLGHAIQDQFLCIGRHELITLSRAACRWKNERQAKKEVSRANCDVLLDARLNASLDSGEELRELEVKRCHWLSKACQRGGSSYFLLSSDRVFSGDIDRLYGENDHPDSDEPQGQHMRQAESLVRESCERHIILRLGPVFSHLSPNWLPSMLQQLRQGDEVKFADYLCGSPVAVAEAARVICGLVDQVSAAAESWGIYHYCSADSATLYELAETLLAAARQFSDIDDETLNLVGVPKASPAINRSLDCSKIHDTFAIRQQPWREFIADTVEFYFQLH